jgi:hypothetical protein
MMKRFKGYLFVAAGLVILLALVHTLATPTSADKEKIQREAVFVAFSQAPTTTDGVVHRIGMSGALSFDVENVEKGVAEGGGVYAHFNQASAVPRTIIDSGQWFATKFVSFKRCGHELFCGSATPSGVYGRITAGILELRVNLISDVNGTETPATLRLICDIGAAGVDTGEPEGFTLAIDGTTFGTFVQLTPISGITHIGFLDRDLIRGNKKAR